MKYVKVEETFIGEGLYLRSFLLMENFFMIQKSVLIQNWMSSTILLMVDL